VRIQLPSSAAGLSGARLSARAADIAAGRVTPSVPRDAATVMVLRAAPVGGDLEVLMLRRVAGMKFAPGAYVFPGGSVDEADHGAEIGWHGPDPAEFGARLGASPGLARALVCAAVRETYEEAGVLLAGTQDGIAEPSGPSWEADRLALAGSTMTLAGLLSRRDLLLRADLLVPWARWITPEAEPRRFDARFFVAALPQGQQPTRHEAESDTMAWMRPADALEAARAGEISMLPPTAVTLNDFAVEAAAGGGVADILAARRTIRPVLPRLVVSGGEAWLDVPE
jgi:8-oxo-dGTP pyrophosphatase MutT (NUDIX family)